MTEAQENAVDPDVRPMRVGDFKSIAPATAAATRLLCDPRVSQWLSEAHRVDVRRRFNAPLTSDALKVTLRCPTGTITLSFPQEVLPVLTLAVKADAAGGPAVATIVASRLLAPLIEQFSRVAKAAGDMRWHSVGVSSITAIPASASSSLTPLVSLDVTLTNQLFARVALLAIDPECARDLQDMIDAKPVRQHPAMSTWRVATGLCLGTKRWKTSLLNTLEVGDVLICKENATIDSMDAQIYCGASFARHWVGNVRINQQEMTMTSQIEVQDADFEGNAEALGPELTANVAELDVPVRFELDSAALSLSQLASLRPGYVIELSIPIDQADIRLVSCGQLIGRGKLVVVGDCLGVQLEHLVPGNT